MFDPFRLFGRCILAAFKIAGYVVSYGCQALLHLTWGERSHVGDAIGELGHSVTDAIAGIFESR
jgi:hypothetical protein